MQIYKLATTVTGHMPLSTNAYFAYDKYLTMPGQLLPISYGFIAMLTVFIVDLDTAVFIGIVCLVLCSSIAAVRHPDPLDRLIPVSVNYHFTRKCNYQCGFCFHTAKTSHIEPLPSAKAGLKLLEEAGMRKLNFAGGEPFLYPDHMGELIRYSKEVLGIESVSIVTNGSKVQEDFMIKYGRHIDIIAVSCDSFNEETNVLIGRGNGYHLDHVYKLSILCQKYGVKFKINSVINRFNFEEDMNRHISELNPARWKCFQVLILPGENSSDADLRNAQKFVISDQEYAQFCARHAQQPSFVAESNDAMRSSYLILDEFLRFLDKANNGASKSILEGGVAAALKEAGWDQGAFVDRGGIYDWTRTEQPCQAEELDW